MKIEAAVHHILGDEIANAIILDMGIHWAVVAAMAKATTDHSKEALAAIDLFNAEQKAALAPQGSSPEKGE